MINFNSASSAKIVEVTKCAAQKTTAQIALPEASDSFSSRNLLHFLKKKLHSVDEITSFINRLSDDEKYIGCLPDGWRKKLDQSDIKNQTLEIQKLLSDFAKNCSCGRWDDPEPLQPKVDELAFRLEKYFGPCKVGHFKRGNFGKVLRIQCADEDVALKIYHNNCEQYLLNNHGPAKEIANAVYLNHTLKPNQCSRFYCAKIGINKNEYDNGSFMLTGFLDSANAIRKRKLLWNCRRFHFGDERGENFINGKMVDYGAIKYNFENPNQLSYAKVLYPLIQGGHKEEVLEMQKKYEGDIDFDKALSKARILIEEKVDYPYSFAAYILDGRFAKKHIEVFKALGVDFSNIANMNFSSDEMKSVFDSVSLRPEAKSKENCFKEFVTFMQKLFNK